MFKYAHIPDHRSQKELPKAFLEEKLLHPPDISATDREEPATAFPKNELLLPVPDPEDIAGFITLYRDQYGIELQSEQAHEILGGLMRFLYLTRGRMIKPQVHAQKPSKVKI